MFDLQWLPQSKATYIDLKNHAFKALQNRKIKEKAKSSPVEGVFKQVNKTLDLLRQNPRHPGLHTHEFSTIKHPYQKDNKVFEAYAQNQTPGAYRVFWCYGPGKKDITIIAITPHP